MNVAWKVKRIHRTNPLMWGEIEPLDEWCNNRWQWRLHGNHTFIYEQGRGRTEGEAMADLNAAWDKWIKRLEAGQA